MKSAILALWAAIIMLVSTLSAAASPVFAPSAPCAATIGQIAPPPCGVPTRTAGFGSRTISSRGSRPARPETSSRARHFRRPATHDPDDRDQGTEPGKRSGRASVLRDFRCTGRRHRPRAFGVAMGCGAADGAAKCSGRREGLCLLDHLGGALPDRRTPGQTGGAFMLDGHRRVRQRRGRAGGNSARPCRQLDRAAAGCGRADCKGIATRADTHRTQGRAGCASVDG